MITIFTSLLLIPLGISLLQSVQQAKLEAFIALVVVRAIQGRLLEELIVQKTGRRFILTF